jgi:hypothetical protein
VRLKNGGLLRGTIAELVPNDAVVIVLVTGETRRVPMAEVDYAGPAANAPSPEAPPAVRPPPPSDAPSQPSEPAVPTVQFVSADPVTVFRRASGSAEYQKVCTTPCEAPIDRGYHDFSIAAQGSDDHRQAGGLMVTGNATVEAKYRSRSGLRGAGWVTLAVGGGIGAALWLTATSEEEVCVGGPCTTVEVTNETQLWIGRIVTVTSIAAGIALIAIPDGASVKLLPAMSGFLPMRKHAATFDASTPAAAFPGIVAIAKF